MSNTPKRQQPQRQPGEAARKAEALDDRYALVEWRANTFRVPRQYEDWTVDMVESLEEGKAVGIVRGALGPQQWRTVRTMNCTMRDLNELAELVTKALGFGDLGESSASAG